MDTIFMNSEISKTSELHVLVLNLTEKLDLRGGAKSIAISNLSIYHTWENIKSSCNNNKFKISASTWNDKLELPDGSYFALDIQEHFEYILEKQKENIDNPSIRIYVNEIEKRITCRTKTGYYHEILTPETMKSLGSTENKIT